MQKRNIGFVIALGMVLVAVSGCAKEDPAPTAPPKGASQIQASSPGGAGGAPPPVQATTPQRPAGAPP